MKRRAYKIIDFSDIDDVDAAIHAGMGLYSRAIGKKFGLTPGQAQHRVAKAGASEARRQWRDGTSPLYKALSAGVLSEIRESEQKRLIVEYQKRREQQIRERHAQMRARTEKKR